MGVEVLFHTSNIGWGTFRASGYGIVWTFSWEVSNISFSKGVSLSRVYKVQPVVCSEFGLSGGADGCERRFKSLGECSNSAYG